MASNPLFEERAGEIENVRWREKSASTVRGLRGPHHQLQQRGLLEN